MADNPLQALTFIAAPALLTNACSLLVLSTSNRFARAVDRTRLLAKSPPDDAGAALARVERRALMLVRALTAFYTAIGSFAGSTFFGLFAAAEATSGRVRGLSIITDISLGFATIGVFSIGVAATMLVAETWSAYRGLMIEAKTIARHKIRNVDEVG